MLQYTARYDEKWEGGRVGRREGEGRRGRGGGREGEGRRGREERGREGGGERREGGRRWEGGKVKEDLKGEREGEGAEDGREHDKIKRGGKGGCRGLKKQRKCLYLFSSCFTMPIYCTIPNLAWPDAVLE